MMDDIMTPLNYRYHIGIDPGTNTGFAIWDRHDKCFVAICTCSIHEAMFRLLDLMKEHPGQVYVRFEDARLISGSNMKSQGAGSIKRDCNIWQDFLTDYKIPFAGRAPQKQMTKWSDEFFKRQTGWAGMTSNHARDAAILVWNR